MYERLTESKMDSPQVNRTVGSRKEGEMWSIWCHALLHLGGIVLVDVLLHFLYILSIPTDMKLLRHLSDWAVGLSTPF